MIGFEFLKFKIKILMVEGALNNKKYSVLSISKPKVRKYSQILLRKIKLFFKGTTNNFKELFSRLTIFSVLLLIL